MLLSIAWISNTNTTHALTGFTPFRFSITPNQAYPSTHDVWSMNPCVVERNWLTWASEHCGPPTKSLKSRLHQLCFHMQGINTIDYLASPFCDTDREVEGRMHVFDIANEGVCVCTIIIYKTLDQLAPHCLGCELRHLRTAMKSGWHPPPHAESQFCSQAFPLGALDGAGEPSLMPRDFSGSICCCHNSAPCWGVILDCPALSGLLKSVRDVSRTRLNDLTHWSQAQLWPCYSEWYCLWSVRTGLFACHPRAWVRSPG